MTPGEQELCSILDKVAGGEAPRKSAMLSLLFLAARVGDSCERLAAARVIFRRYPTFAFDLLRRLLETEGNGNVAAEMRSMLREVEPEAPRDQEIRELRAALARMEDVSRDGAAEVTNAPSISQACAAAPDSDPNWPQWSKTEADAAADELDKVGAALAAAEASVRSALMAITARYKASSDRWDAIAAKRGYTTYVR